MWYTNGIMASSAAKAERKGGIFLKRTLRYRVGEKEVEREINYIPVRYIIAAMITVLEIVAIIGVVVALCYFVPYFYLAAFATQIVCMVRIISSDDNPDYKVPWLVFVMILPIAGFMLYLMFYSRKLHKRFIRRLDELWQQRYQKDDSALLQTLRAESPVAAAEAELLTKLSYSRLFTDTKQTYFPLGEEMHESMLKDLKNAEKFIFLEYFIIEQGKFWNSILEILEEKAKQGIAVRVLYDDVGCMSTLPGSYYKTLRAKGIEAAPFSRLRGNADSEFNNRNHRKILVIDGKVGYTGGVNLADEYINEVERFGHWKDTGLRLEGEAVFELTRLFLVDYGISVKEPPAPVEGAFPAQAALHEQGYVIPFGDGPRPIYARRVSKSLIQSMFYDATRYVWVTTPYLILDNDTLQSIENAALRGVDVRIVLPHIPDKRLVFWMSQSYYRRLTEAGVKIYEYTPGFIHAKSYLVDGEIAMIGTVNLDYRSLVHHFENGVWMYRCAAIADLKADMEETFEKSALIKKEDLRSGPIKRLVRAIARIFAPMM